MAISKSLVGLALVALVAPALGQSSDEVLLATITTTVVVLVFLCICIGIILNKSVVIIHQAEGMVIERFGRFQRILNPGLNFIVPIIDYPREFTWKKTAFGSDGRVHDTTTVSARIDLRESVFNFLSQEVFSKGKCVLSPLFSPFLFNAN